MTDRIVLTLPAEARFRSVATLVLGGIGSRFDLPYERVDDLQLAVLSVLETGGDGRVTLEVEGEQGGLTVSLGPLRDGTALGQPPSRACSSPLVDAVEPEDRDGAEWLTLRLGSHPRAAEVPAQALLGVNPRSGIPVCALATSPRSPRPSGRSTRRRRDLRDVGLREDPDELPVRRRRAAAAPAPTPCAGARRRAARPASRRSGSRSTLGDRGPCSDRGPSPARCVHEVAVGDHPDELAVLHDRERADVLRRHPLRRLDGRSRRSRPWSARTSSPLERLPSPMSCLLRWCPDALSPSARRRKRRNRFENARRWAPQECERADASARGQVDGSAAGSPLRPPARSAERRGGWRASSRG